MGKGDNRQRKEVKKPKKVVKKKNTKPTHLSRFCVRMYIIYDRTKIKI